MVEVRDMVGASWGTIEVRTFNILGQARGMVGRENCNSGGMVGARGMIGVRLRNGLYKVYIRSWFI